MLYLVLASILVVLVLVGVVLFLVNRKKDFDSYEVNLRMVGGGIAGVAVIALVLTTFFMSLTKVDARAVGIQTSFGKYQDTLNNGLQLTAPWSETEQFSTQVQYLDLDDTDGSQDSVSVTFKGGGGGQVSLTPRWRIDENKAENLWKKYRTFDKVQDQLVNSSAKDSVRVVVSKYTPNEARDGENLRPIADQIQADLAKSLKDDGVIIDSISIKKIQLDSRSQASLDKIVEANNNVERAKAEQERAKIDAETVKIREKSGSLSPQANERFCLEMMNNWDAKKNGNLPAGFTCNTGAAPFVVTNK
jgi:regulator of protease activity HflC (stomatin/prohibitin superfamily)